jgi:hypothetical protein
MVRILVGKDPATPCVPWESLEVQAHDRHLRDDPPSLSLKLAFGRVPFPRRPFARGVSGCLWPRRFLGGVTDTRRFASRSTEGTYLTIDCIKGSRKDV